MKTSTAGKSAENSVAKYLEQHGHSVIARNWKNRVCEIDLVTKMKNVVYFIEVKYRSSDTQGDGFSYITPKKLKQVEFAAAQWIAENSWDGDYRLIGVSVTGTTFENIEFVEI